jgi:hypothetical protein
MQNEQGKMKKEADTVISHYCPNIHLESLKVKVNSKAIPVTGPGSL